MNHLTSPDELLRLVAERAIEQSGTELPCATQEQVNEAEVTLGFSLPPLLAQLYQKVGNGGFGPDYQILPLIGSDEHTVVSTYQAEQAPGRWPIGVLPILDWGCAMYAAVDCTSADAPVLLFEPNAVDDDWSDAWFQDADSLADWLQIWLSGSGWYEEENAMNEDFPEPPPWSQAKGRLS